MDHRFLPVTRDEVPTEFCDAERNVVPDDCVRRLGLPAGSEVVPRVAIELPDFILCHEWMEWYTSQPVTKDTVCVTITSLDEWKNRQDVAAAILRKLWDEGKPEISPILAYMEK